MEKIEMKKVSCKNCQRLFDISMNYIGKFPLCKICREKHKMEKEKK